MQSAFTVRQDKKRVFSTRSAENTQVHRIKKYLNMQCSLSLSLARVRALGYPAANPTVALLARGIIGDIPRLPRVQFWQIVKGQTRETLSLKLLIIMLYLRERSAEVPRE